MSLILGNSLLAATLLLGQPASGPSAPVEGDKIVQVQNVQGQPMAQQQPTRPILGFFRNNGNTFSNNNYTEERPIWNKLTGWFRRDNNQDQQQQFQQQPRGGNVIRETTPPPILNSKPMPNDYYKRMPSPTSKAKSMVEQPIVKDATAGKEVKQASVQQVAAPTTKSPIRKELANVIGRDEKFEWITGQLEMENGNFVLYYATPETVDKYHGRVVLLPEKADLKQFRSGELISVRGNLTQRQTMQGIVPIYHVTMANRIDRPKQ